MRMRKRICCFDASSSVSLFSISARIYRKWPWMRRSRCSKPHTHTHWRSFPPMISSTLCTSTCRVFVNSIRIIINLFFFVSLISIIHTITESPVWPFGLDICVIFARKHFWLFLEMRAQTAHFLSVSLSICFSFACSASAECWPTELHSRFIWKQNRK